MRSEAGGTPSSLPSRLLHRSFFTLNKSHSFLSHSHSLFPLSKSLHDRAGHSFPTSPPSTRSSFLKRTIIHRNPKDTPFFPTPSPSPGWFPPPSLFLSSPPPLSPLCLLHALWLQVILRFCHRLVQPFIIHSSSLSRKSMSRPSTPVRGVHLREIVGARYPRDSCPFVASS